MSGSSLPVALASTLLLHFLGIGVDMAALGEVAREVLNVIGGAVGEAGMVTVVVFV